MSDSSRGVSDRIRSLIEAGQLESALEAVDRALPQCNGAERIRILCLTFLVLFTRTDALARLRLASNAHAVAPPLGDSGTECEALLTMGFALQGLEQHARAIERLHEAERLAHQMGDVSLHARAMRRLGVSLSVLGRHDQATTMLADAVVALQAHGSEADACHAEYSLIAAESRALDAQELDAADSALPYTRLMHRWGAFAESMARRGLARLESMAIGNAGIAAQRVGSLDLALDRLCRADRMQVANRSTSHRAITQSHIGEIDLALGQRAQRIAAISEAITSMAEGRPRDRMEAWDALAIVDEANGDAAAALAAMKEARAIERRLHDEDAHVAAAECEQRAEISRIVDEWSRLADPDALTGLPNRRAFDRRMSELLALAHKGTPFALILFDLDHFKRINDLYGHAIGDAVLKRFAHLLAADRRASDPPARVGGEEFAVLVLSTIGETTVIAERVRTAVAAADSTAIDPGLSVTFSAGVACSHEVGDVATVFARADQRLYVAKNKGRNRIVATD